MRFKIDEESKEGKEGKENKENKEGKTNDKSNKNVTTHAIISIDDSTSCEEKNVTNKEIGKQSNANKSGDPVSLKNIFKTNSWKKNIKSNEKTDETKYSEVNEQDANINEYNISTNKNISKVKSFLDKIYNKNKLNDNTNIEKEKNLKRK